MRIALVLNPAARSGRTAREADAVLAEAVAAGLDATLFRTAGPGDGAPLARALAGSGRVDAVVAVGGDGTVHEVADGLLAADAGGATGAGVAFGVVPLGTGNDFVKMLRVPPTWRGAVWALKGASVRRFDAIALGWRSDRGAWTTGTCVNTLGVGLDARVAAEAVRFKRYGSILGYLMAVGAALRGWRSPRARVWLDDAPTPVFDGPFFLCTVGNGTCSGGSYRLTPDAAPDDGVLDVCIVAEQPMRRVPRLLALAVRGRHVGQPGVTMATARRVRVEIDAPSALHADGELMTVDAREVTVDVRPGVLPVLG